MCVEILKNNLSKRLVAIVAVTPSQTKMFLFISKSIPYTLFARSSNYCDWGLPGGKTRGNFQGCRQNWGQDLAAPQRAIIDAQDNILYLCLSSSFLILTLKSQEVS